MSDSGKTPADVAPEAQHRLVLEFVRMMNGLSQAEAFQILENAKTVVGLTAVVDVGGMRFREQVKGFNEFFGANAPVGANDGN